MGWTWPSEKSDTEFLKGMGIAPCPDLPDPHFRNPGPPSVLLTEEDFALLRGMHIQGWLYRDGQTERSGALLSLRYAPPRSMQEFLARYPVGIAAAVRKEAPRMGYVLAEEDVRAATKRIVEELWRPVEGGRRTRWACMPPSGPLPLRGRREALHGLYVLEGHGRPS